MGQIGYELDADQFEGDVYDLLWRGYGLIIHANIGDVDITPAVSLYLIIAELRNSYTTKLKVFWKKSLLRLSSTLMTRLPCGMPVLLGLE